MQHIGNLSIEILEKYEAEVITSEVILTDERLNEHILVHHKSEYEKLKLYLKDIIEKPDIVIKDNKNEKTIILLKKIISKNINGRVVIKIAVAGDEKHPKNSIITLMQLNERTWNQTIKNRGNIIFEKN